MQKLPFLLLAGLSLLASRVQAQVSFSVGPRVGLNVATCHYTNPPASGTPGYRPGLEAGVGSTLGFGHLSLQAAALYSQQGYTSTTIVDIRTGTNQPVGTAESVYRNRLNYLSIPLALAYSLRPDGQGFQAFAGPYVSVLLSGRYDIKVTPQTGPADSYEGPLTPVSSAPATYGAYAQRFDAGLHAGLGYRYQALLFQVGYSLGLRNVAVYGQYSASAINTDHYNRVFQASLAYLFGGKN